jgi:hypothetical protein
MRGLLHPGLTKLTARKFYQLDSSIARAAQLELSTMLETAEGYLQLGKACAPMARLPNPWLAWKQQCISIRITPKGAFCSAILTRRRRRGERHVAGLPQGFGDYAETANISRARSSRSSCKIRLRTESHAALHSQEERVARRRRAISRIRSWPRTCAGTFNELDRMTIQGIPQ